jgi:predicted RNase H-like HicB family nuclease
MKYVVIYEKTNTGYSCYVPDLPGCIAAGDDLSQTQALVKRAIEIHLKGMREDGDPIPKPRTLGAYLDVEIPATTSTTRRRSKVNVRRHSSLSRPSIPQADRI